MEEQTHILLGGSAAGQLLFNPAMANRHGLIAGATGTGKTVTLQILAESFSRLGVPVFTADVKGDLSGIAKPAVQHPKIDQRIAAIGMTDYVREGSPVVFWDVFAERGHPVRTTISEMGPVLLSNILELNETQEGVLHIAFKLADDEGLLLLDLKDLRSLIEWVGLNAKEVSTEYGNVHTSSIAAIQRRLLVLDEAGGEFFFGEPALKIQDFMQHDFSGRGVVSILDARTLINNPRVYATFLLWLLSELFEELEEVGDQALPQMVFFFDEAHLLFDNAPDSLIQKIEQVVRLIRSKGVGVFFVTQHPLDIPEKVAGQLGNRIQHALRAFTPRDKKAVQTAAETFRQNPDVDTREVITQLGVGEALVSVLNEKGEPSIVQRTLICPPRSRIGPALEDERAEILTRSPLKGRYEEEIDRESAYEILKKRKEELAEKQSAEKHTRSREGATEAFFKSLARSVGYAIGRAISRGVLGSILRKSGR